uniref:Uncharacterized protein n=1 Tax=Anguilla anguilla TaxID=7936 RepID=A0A0E9TVJ1_ANGAN
MTLIRLSLAPFSPASLKQKNGQLLVAVIQLWE